MPIERHPARDGNYRGEQLHPDPLSIEFRVDHGILLWPPGEREFDWDGDSRWVDAANPQHYIYFIPAPPADPEPIWIEHDLSQAPPFAASGTWRPA